MFPFLESIKIKNNIIQHLYWHKARIAHTLKYCYGSNVSPINFSKLQEAAFNLDYSQTYKLRILYDLNAFEYQFVPYKRKVVHSLKLVEAPNLEYALKYSDRTELDTAFQLRRSCDDIIITQKGIVRDSYYCNLAFLKNGIWYTPNEPLLEGTKRAWLLHTGQVELMTIHQKQITEFECVSLFNALIELQELCIDTSAIEIT